MTLWKMKNGSVSSYQLIHEINFWKMSFIPIANKCHVPDYAFRNTVLFSYVILLQYDPPSLKLWYKKNLLRFYLIINNYVPFSQWISFIRGVLHKKILFCPFIPFQLNGFELTISFYSVPIHSCPVTGKWSVTSQSPFHVYKIEQCFCILKMIYRIIVTLGIKNLNLIQ